MDTVLLVTATRIETATVLDVFRPASARADRKPLPGRHNVYHDLGTVGGSRIWLVQSEMGASGLGASQQTLHEAIAMLKPTAVIMVGLAFGLRPSSQSLGDVLVSKQLMHYEPQRVGGQQTTPSIVPRGFRVDAPMRLVSRFRAADVYARRPRGRRADGQTRIRVQFGLLLTGEKLVDNLAFRKTLSALEPEAIGGEMEGAGLYVACQAEKVDWMIVKAICDWADGHKILDKTRRQRRAAFNAATFVRHTLEHTPLDQPLDSGVPPARVVRERSMPRAAGRSERHRRVSREQTTHETSAAEQDLEEYRKAIAMVYGSVHWPRGSRVPTRTAYWPLSLRPVGAGPEAPRVAPDCLIALSDATLSGRGLIVIEGDPGCGKTVLLDHLAWLAGTDDRSRVPALVSLYRSVQFRRSRRVSLGALVQRSVRRVLAGASRRKVAELSATVLSPAGVILLDGWDEAPLGRRRALAEEIRFAAQHTRVVLTTRRYQDLSALAVDSETSYFEICELSDDAIRLALENEIASAGRHDSARRARLARLQNHWNLRAAAVRSLARNPQTLRLVIEFYSAQGRPEAIPSEPALVGAAITYVGARRASARFPVAELEPSGRVARALGAWCWSVLGDPHRRHGHREIVASELRPFWERRGLRADRLRAWLEHLAANTMWFQKTMSGDAFGQQSAYQIVHPLFVSYLAAASLVARALLIDRDADGAGGAPRREITSGVLHELETLASDTDDGGIDEAVAAQVCRFIGALMPLPDTLRVEDILCRLLQQDSNAASRMALQLIAGESQSRVTRTRSAIGRSSADQIAAHIRSQPRRERVSVVKRWHVEVLRARRIEENYAVEILRALRGLLLTPSGSGAMGQRASVPLNGWIEKDSEVVVRAYALLATLQERAFPDLGTVPDEFHQLWDGRLGILAPARRSEPPRNGHWVAIPAGVYFVGDDTLSRRGRALPRHAARIGRASDEGTAGTPPIMFAKYPVTSREFAEFDPERKAGAPYDEPSRPVVFLTWFDALLYARWRAKRDSCLGIDLPTEEEWEVATTLQQDERDTVQYPWSHREPDLPPVEWRDLIAERLQALDLSVLKTLGAERPWEYGPWLLPLDRDGEEMRVDAGHEVRISATGVWDANGVAQWTVGDAGSHLSSTVGLKVEASRCVRGSGWGPGRDELYRCAYRRAFTPDFSSFLTGCRLVWRRDPTAGDPVCDVPPRSLTDDPSAEGTP